jgi:serine/threonine protein kinase
MDCKLSTLLMQHTKESFPFRNKAQILYQVSLGLAFLHGRVPVTAHGDVTSDSVLVDWSSNRAKLTNIAMATVCSSKSTRTGLLQSLSLKTDEEASSKLILSTVDDVKAFGFLSLHALNHTPPKCNLSFTNAVFKDDESLDDVIKRIHCTILTHDEDRFVSRVVTKCLKYCTIASSTLAAKMKGIVEECTEVSAVKLHHIDKPRSEKHTGSSSVQGGSSDTSTGREAPPTIAVGSTQPIKCKKGKSHRVSTQGHRPSSMPSSDIDVYVNIIPILPRSLQTRQTCLGAEGGEGSINSEENELIRRIIEIENVESGEGIMPSAGDGEEQATKKEPNEDHCVYFLEEILAL